MIILDSILEQFNLSFNEFDFIDQSDVFREDGYEFYKRTITEATTPVEKKNVFIRLVEIIKKFFGWIGRAFKRFVGWIASLFKKKTKTADQILSEVTKIRSRRLSQLAGTNQKRISIILSRTDNSIPIQDHVDVSFKSLFAKFNEDGDAVQFSVEGINTALNDHDFDKFSDIKRQTISVGGGAFIVATVILIMIKDESLAQ